MKKQPHKILSDALKKAVSNGFYSFAMGAFGVSEFVVLPEDNYGQIKVHVKGHPDTYWSAEAILFNPDFARALWPWRDGSKCPYCKTSFPSTLEHPYPCPLQGKTFPYLWQYHMYQMLLNEDRIAYLGENL